MCVFGACNIQSYFLNAKCEFTFNLVRRGEIPGYPDEREGAGDRSAAVL
jgi:hypothetical protein